jgi:hypothetical protein
MNFSRLLRRLSWTLLLLATLSAQARQGGGYTLAGLVGTYFTNSTFNGPPGFTRREVRIDFGTNSLPPGGAGQSGDLAFRSVPAENFSVRWTGQVVPRFTETYTIRSLASGGLRVRLRAAGAAEWTTVIDQPAAADSTGTFAFTAASPCDIDISFTHGTGPWSARLLWSSPSTPEEVIDPAVQSGINNPDWTAGFTDIIKAARNSWEPINGGARPAMDADGWPLGDGAYVFQESLNQGLDIDPLMRGRVSFSFKGRATVSLQGNVQSGSLTSQYNTASNLTTGSFVVRSNGWNASYFRFAGTDRDGLPGGEAGITELRLMRPVAPDATSSYSAGTSLFTPQLLEALTHFTVVRHQLVANQQRDWAERTRPGYFNQSGGAVGAPHYGVGANSDNGAAWEHKILLANESGRDLMLSLPTVASGRLPADTASYLWKLACLLRYGSDGVEPYTSAVADPVYPPLNPNLRVYLEIENELWNWAGVFYTDFGNINALTILDADANNEDFQALNFDGLSTAKDAGGNYVSLNTWRYRKIMLRLVQISDIFRAVFGDPAMMSRIRPLYEWQYDNANDTARLALTFADRYFNNGDGQPHVAAPYPISHWLWGGGGAAYYGAVNGNGLTSLLPNSDFATPALPTAGYQVAPAGAAWNFMGAAGIARDGGSGDDIPPAFHGSQAGYITDRSQASIAVTFPADFTSSVFAVSFKAVNRTQTGAATADRENLRVYLDSTNDITARTFSQGNGYTPAAYDSSNPWYANNVFWTRSEYYYTRSFNVQPGSTHTITFRGLGDTANAAATNQTAFLGEVRVTSVDRIFGDGMPGGGEATGQPIGQNIRRVMNIEASWAKAFGLEQLSYESGWSLGGDDGGSWLQLRAKYGDARTARIQSRFMDFFHLAGSAVNVFGTYAQWPSWADYYAEQGLLNVANYPIVQGIDDRASQLPPESDNGTLTPAVLGPAQATLSDRADIALGRINNAGGWINWNLVVSRSGNHTLNLTSIGTNGSAVLLLDDAPLATSSGNTNLVVNSTWIAKGFHSLKVRSVGTNTFQVQRITISGVSAPGSPTLLSVADGDGQANLTWTAVPGATGYQVRYGTLSGAYTTVIDAGSATNLTIAGLTNNQQYFFVVIASNASGDSLPSGERGVIPLGSGQLGRLVVWEFTGFTGSETSAPAASASSRLTTTQLVRGTGLVPSQSSWAATMRVNRFGSEPAGSAGNSYGTNLSTAISRRQYYQFTITPVSGQTLSLQQLSFRAFFQNSAGGAGITWSTNGVDFSPGLAATGSASSAATPWTVPLSSQAALQNTAASITFRIYLFGLGDWQISALGDSSGDDTVLTGSFSPVRARLGIAPLLPNAILLSWPTNSGNTQVESTTALNQPPPWPALGLTPQLQGDQWTLTMPLDGSARFFRLSQ